MWVRYWFGQITDHITERGEHPKQSSTQKAYLRRQKRSKNLNSCVGRWPGLTYLTVSASVSPQQIPVQQKRQWSTLNLKLGE